MLLFILIIMFGAWSTLAILGILTGSFGFTVYSIIKSLFRFSKETIVRHKTPTITVTDTK